ncbi:MAG TPA: DUF4199 family protein [Bacteroidota bacterium]
MLDKPSKWRSAVLGGIAIGLVSGIPVISLVNCCCCAGILGGGVLTYYLYQKEHAEGMVPLESSDALIVGIMAGLVGAFVQAVVHGILMVLFAGVSQDLMRNLFEKLIDRMEQSGSIPSGTVDQLREQIESSMKESNTMWGLMVNLFTSLIIYPIFSMLGGLLGYGIFKPKKPQQMQPTPTAPQ